MALPKLGASQRDATVAGLFVCFPSLFLSVCLLSMFVMMGRDSESRLLARTCTLSFKSNFFSGFFSEKKIKFSRWMKNKKGRREKRFRIGPAYILHTHNFVPGYRVFLMKKKKKKHFLSIFKFIYTLFFSFFLHFEMREINRKKREKENDHSLSATAVSRCVALCGESGNRIFFFISFYNLLFFFPGKKNLC